MFEGIDYYPRKKSKSHKKIWLVFVLIVLALIYNFYFYNTTTNNKQNPATTIVISEPTSVQEIELDNEDIQIQVVDNIESDNIESLDKVIEIYTKNK